MVEKKEKKTRVQINKDYEKKRLQKPCINVIRDVPESTISQLDELVKLDGSKKSAILNAIKDRYEKEIVNKN